MPKTNKINRTDEFTNNEPPDWIDTFTNWPASVEDVHIHEHCCERTVRKWAWKNNIRTLGGNRGPYMFFRKDVLKFRQRPKQGHPYVRDVDGFLEFERALD